MFCRNCGKEVADQAVICVSCGCPPKSGTKFCHSCGAETNPEATVCLKCGVGLGTTAPVTGEAAKSKMTAGLLGIFLGGFGIHRFYLGYTGIGVAQIIVSLITCGIGALWGFIEGILILTGSMNVDAKGIPLKD
ncbi:MAG: NINE protein [Bacteroidota bacterium]